MANAQHNGSPLKSAMERKGMTVRELAAILETDQSIVSRYRGGLVPTAERRRLIAKAVGASQRELWPSH